MPTLFRRSNGIYYILFRKHERQESLALKVLMNDGGNNSPLLANQTKQSSSLALTRFLHEFLVFVRGLRAKISQEVNAESGSDS